LRNFFRRKLFFVEPADFFTGGAVTEPLQTGVFEATSESVNNTSFHVTEWPTLSSLAFLYYLWKGLEGCNTGREQRIFSPNTTAPDGEGKAANPALAPTEEFGRGAGTKSTLDLTGAGATSMDAGGSKSRAGKGGKTKGEGGMTGTTAGNDPPPELDTS
jgi:hypothetical protein